MVNCITGIETYHEFYFSYSVQIYMEYQIASLFPLLSCGPPYRLQTRLLGDLLTKHDTKTCSVQIGKRGEKSSSNLLPEDIMAE